MKICIFGGSGSFGTAMTKKLLEKTNYEIIIFNRSEKAQFEHKQKRDFALKNLPELRKLLDRQGF